MMSTARKQLPIEIRGKRVHVIGLGSLGTGREAAKALHGLGAEVTISDVKSEVELSDEIARLGGTPVALRLGKKAYEGIAEADLVVLSPGVPPDSIGVVRARAAGVTVISEIELAYWLSPAPIVAISGTKGKTTTATLTGELVRAAGRPVLVGGNIGRPLVEQARAATPEHVLVAEVSSFQLEATDRFRPKVGVLLNFFADHLDRHPDLDTYWRAKERLFANQTSEDIAILNRDDAAVWSLHEQIAPSVIPFSLTQRAPGAYLADGRLWVASDRGQTLFSCPAETVRIRGRHNLANALAALAVLRALELPFDQAEATLAAFRGVPNRLEEVQVVDGVTYVNDSQATTPPAVLAALEAFWEPVVLIAGGRPKVDDFRELGEAIAARAKGLVVIGEAAEAIAAAAAGCRTIARAASLPEAVGAAAALAAPGDVVLLSPACASFDMFRNMAHRGEVFRQAVAELSRRRAS